MENGLRFKSRTMQRVEAEQGQPIEAVLLRLYASERLTQEQIAARIRVSRITVIRWMKQIGIQTREAWAA